MDVINPHVHLEHPSKNNNTDKRSIDCPIQFRYAVIAITANSAFFYPQAQPCTNAMFVLACNQSTDTICARVSAVVSL